MFSGIVEEVAVIEEAINPIHGPLTLKISAKKILEDLKIGDSIAVDGVCLTVTSFDRSSATFEVVEETKKLTTLGNVKKGNRVNLERSLCFGGRISGHLVQGHIDGTAKVESILLQSDQSWLVSFRPPRQLLKYIAKKGSIAVSGVSLTVTEVSDIFSVSLIPHTLSVTNLGDLKIDDSINIEVDLIARTLEKLSHSYEFDRRSH